MNKNIIIFYAVSEKHIKKFLYLKRNFHNFEFILVCDKCIDKRSVYKYNEKFYELNNKFFYKIRKILKQVAYVFASTLQARYDPIILSYFFTKYKIPVIAFQETHQFFLHNQDMNNYIIPADKYLICSQFEKQMFLKNGYKSENLEVVGWDSSNYDTKKNECNYNDYILIILNASQQINPISIESLSKQIKLINKIFHSLGDKHKYIVKIHPAESKDVIFKIKNKINKKIHIIFNEFDSLTLIRKANVIFSTGYTESILEAIFLNKKIIIVPLENNLNLLKDNRNIVTSFKNINSHIFDYKYEDSKKIYQINQLNLTNEIFISNVKKSISDSNLIYSEDYRTCCLIDISIWLFYFGNYNKSLQIIIFLMNKRNIKYHKLLNALKNIYLKKYFINEIDYIFSQLKNRNSYFAFKYIAINAKDKKIINNILSLDHISFKEPRYFADLLFYNYQNFLNLLLVSNRIDEFNKLFYEHFNNYKKIYKSKSILHNLYFILRNNYLIKNYLPLFKRINYIVYLKLFIK